ncbi:hypothetical protein SCMU_35070 [Sinomonas cyclohexanicum]|uniref:Uncharacterized protein n=1 Tax=Sinomonas cyclohexanicum TaxID=322009 RepID=A0ABM7PZD2_SINCY|nr:hypothetical protein SCMU_35070 [Corynebacterium cyclohexanicum]
MLAHEAHTSNSASAGVRLPRAGPPDKEQESGETARSRGPAEPFERFIDAGSAGCNGPQVID